MLLATRTNSKKEIPNYAHSFGKRSLDVTLALLALVGTWPLGLVAWCVGVVVFEGEPLFVQKRVGHQQQAFRLWKFRTMYDTTDSEGILLPDAARLSRWGRWLRRTHLDEWPQLVQIVWGTMSWVGPRPLLPEYVPYYTALENRRHAVRPGITGLAQIKGGNALPWKTRLRWDAVYVYRCSLALDLYLLKATLRRVYQNENTPVYSERLDQERVERN